MGNAGCMTQEGPSARSSYESRPWLAAYGAGIPWEIEPAHGSCVDMFRAAVEQGGARPLVHYFDSTLTVAEVDEESDALALALHGLGVRKGDGVGLILQNVPQFVIATLAAWKLGAVVVPISPLLKARELSFVLRDSEAKLLVTLESLHGTVAAVLGESSVDAVITTSELDYLTGEVPQLLADVERTPISGTHDWRELADRYRGDVPDRIEVDAADVAFVTYTSGTTGPQKGAMSTHANVVFNAETYRTWVGLTPDDVILGLAPLFHITGLVAYVAVSLLVPIPCVLSYRFDPETTLALAKRHAATFTVGSITAFIALMNHPGAASEQLSTLRKCVSGGAPIAPATVEAWEASFGSYIYNVYGLTETTSPSHCVPLGRRAPVDPASGALSVGLPVFNTDVRIVDDGGNALPPNTIGEIATSGPQVTPGYWRNPEETRRALPGGELRTGDLGFMNDEGWFFVVDRKKDLINVSGFKVWPREVEDVLYEHQAVREAAVVGVPDAYRGEVVRAFVSLRPAQTVSEAELITHCKERLAPYKYPRSVEILDELPKTASGKLLRRELRAAAQAAGS
jgi:long-chain acyl-CoA synthetase